MPNTQRLVDNSFATPKGVPSGDKIPTEENHHTDVGHIRHPKRFMASQAMCSQIVTMLHSYYSKNI